MRKNLFFIFINLLVALSVGGQSVTRLLATSPFDNTLVVFDTATYATITTKTMPFSLGTYQGINGLARKPSTGVFYAVVNNGSGTRYLATLNPVNGSLTSIGSLGDNFSQLTFNGNGTLLGVTGAGASNPCKVYRINVNNASKSLAGTGTVVTSYGQIICYNPVDNRVYHWSGGSPTFNSYDTSFTSAPVNLTITAGNEVVGAVYKTGGIFVTHDFNGNILKTRSTGSSTVSLNYTSHYFKGLAYITCSRSITPSLPVACSNTTVSAITLTMSGTAGATYQWYKNNVAISGATLNTITTPTTAFGYYKCMINDGCGQDSLAPGVTFTTAPPPVVSITGGTFACPPTATVQLVGSSGGTSQWYLNGVAISGATTNSYVPTVSGRYNMIKTNLNGCKDSASVGKDVVVGSTPTLNIVASQTVVCAGQNTVNLVVSGASSYTWTSGPNSATYAVVPSATSIYTVSGSGTTACQGTQTVQILANPLPTVTVNSATVCSGNTFTIVPSGASTYTFSSGASTVSAISSTNISVTGTSSLGCVSAAAVSSITVIPSPTITASNGSVCAGLSYSILPAGASTYSINSLSTSTAAVVFPNSTTSYSITGTGTNGCVSGTFAVATVTVYANPVLTLTPASPSICIGQQTTVLTASGANTYSWSTSASSSSIAVSPALTTVYTLTGTSVQQCKTNTSVVVFVNPLPNVVPVISNTFVCVGGSSTLSASGANTYSWNTSATSSSIVVTPSVTSNYTVTGTDNNGCYNQSILTVNVNNITLSLSPSTSICLGSTATLTANGAVSYMWNNLLPFQTITPSPSVATVYSVVAVDINNCTLSGSVSVGVFQLPNVSASASNTLICLGESASLSVSGANTYTWNTGSNAASFVVTPTLSIAYNYTVTGTDNNGCVNNASVKVTVSPCTSLLDPAKANENAMVYPNPNRGEFSVITGSNEEKTIEVLDMTGRLVAAQRTSEEVAQINLVSNAAGIYYVKITSGKNTKVLKVVKQ